MINALLLVAVCAAASDNCETSIVESWNEPTLEEVRDCATMAGSMSALFRTPVWTQKHPEDTRHAECRVVTADADATPGPAGYAVPDNAPAALKF